MRSVLAVAVVALAVGWTPAAWAMNPNWACAQDAQRLCTGASGMAEINRCLLRNAKSVSGPCQEWFSMSRTLWDRVKSSCQGDIQRWCGPCDLGNIGFWMKCLQDKGGQVTATCRMAMDAATSHSMQQDVDLAQH